MPTTLVVQAAGVPVSLVVVSRLKEFSSKIVTHGRSDQIWVVWVVRVFALARLRIGAPVQHSVSLGVKLGSIVDLREIGLKLYYN